MNQEPIEYPIVSISYCVKCNWVLRACWYQQEILQTFTSKAKTPEEAIVRSIVLKPSFVSGTFKVYVKASAESEWIQVWDRVEHKGFPEAKILKQYIRNVLSPETKLGHSDKISILDGTLVSDSSLYSQTQTRAGSVISEVPLSTSSTHESIGAPLARAVSEAETVAYGSPRLAAAHKTFCEECLETMPPTWET